MEDKMKERKGPKKFGTLQLDPYCSFCEHEWAKIKAGNLRDDELVILNPSFNCYGLLTGYHINVIKVNESLKWLEENIEQAKKDFKKYREENEK
jgi:hypothetical protein